MTRPWLITGMTRSKDTSVLSVFQAISGLKLSITASSALIRLKTAPSVSLATDAPSVLTPSSPTTLRMSAFDSLKTVKQPLRITSMMERGLSALTAVMGLWSTQTLVSVSYVRLITVLDVIVLTFVTSASSHIFFIMFLMLKMKK